MMACEKNEATPISFLCKSRQIFIKHALLQLNDMQLSEVMAEVDVDSMALDVGGRIQEPKSYNGVCIASVMCCRFEAGTLS